VDTTQLLKGVLDLAVLEVLRQRDGYGYEIVTHLRESGLEAVGEASVYGTLRRLHAEGLLDSYAEPSESGPHRRYYRITGPGEARRHELAKTWRQFVEVMDGIVEEAHG
jgi:PadR family transcriptional regulator, regulatory protein PadR